MTGKLPVGWEFPRLFFGGGRWSGGSKEMELACLLLGVTSNAPGQSNHKIQRPEQIGRHVGFTRCGRLAKGDSARFSGAANNARVSAGQFCPRAKRQLTKPSMSKQSRPESSASADARAKKSPRVSSAFLGNKLIGELKILMRLARPAKTRVWRPPSTKPGKKSF